MYVADVLSHPANFELHFTRHSEPQYRISYGDQSYVD
jgi:hypothetical protein